MTKYNELRKNLTEMLCELGVEVRSTPDAQDTYDDIKRRLLELMYPEDDMVDPEQVVRRV